MIVLLIAHDINHLVDGIVLKAELGCADVLCHVDRGAVAAEQELVIKTLAGEVGPYGAILLAIHLAGGESFEHLVLALEIGLALVVNLVEIHPHALVGLVKTGVDPLVHSLPEGTYFGVFLFPFHEHLAGLFHEG